MWSVVQVDYFNDDSAGDTAPLHRQYKFEYLLHWQNTTPPIWLYFILSHLTVVPAGTPKAANTMVKKYLRDVSNNSL